MDLTLIIMEIIYVNKDIMVIYVTIANIIMEEIKIIPAKNAGVIYWNSLKVIYCIYAWYYG